MLRWDCALRSGLQADVRLGFEQYVRQYQFTQDGVVHVYCRRVSTLPLAQYHEVKCQTYAVTTSSGRSEGIELRKVKHSGLSRV